LFAAIERDTTARKNKMSDAEKSQQPSEEISQRPNYFAGQYLLEDDFKSEQNYHIERQRRHNRLLHVSGIAKGLTVSNNQGLTVKVAAGTAFDSQGRQIILLYEKAVDLVQEANNKNTIKDGEYTLSIRYSEELTDKQGEDEFTTTRVQEKPEFVLSSSPAKPDDTISLAKLTIKGKNVTIDQNVREYSGINLPTEEGKGVTLRAHVGVPNQVILEGSLCISGGLEIRGESYMKGSLKVQGDLHIVKSLKIGDATETPSVDRIVNDIREATTDIEAEKALITVKAAVDLAETKADKNGNSTEDFTAAQLRVNTITINQKEVTEIRVEINEEEEKENETAIPTVAAIMNYMESKFIRRAYTGVQMEYKKINSEDEIIEITRPLKSRDFHELTIPILRRERIKIIPPIGTLSDLTLICGEEGDKDNVEIKKEQDGWLCKVNKEGLIGVDVWQWEDGRIAQSMSKYINLLPANWEERGWWLNEVGKDWKDQASKDEKIRYEYPLGWEKERRYMLEDELRERGNHLIKLIIEDEGKNIEEVKIRGDGEYVYTVGRFNCGFKIEVKTKERGWVDQGYMYVIRSLGELLELQSIVKKKREEGRVVKSRPPVWSAKLYKT
jgi:hypothetical protein